MKFAELKKHLLTNELYPAYIAVGDDSFLTSLSVQRFSELITISPEMNISIFNETASAQAIVEACEALPFMDEKRLVVVNNFRSNDNAMMVSYLKKPNPSSILLFVTDKLGESYTKLVSYLQVIDCNRLDMPEILTFITLQLRKTESSITADAAELLAEYCARNLTRISRELEKLCAYKGSEPIKAIDVQAFVTAEAEYKIFELSESVAQKDKALSAKILKNLLEYGMPPVNLMSLLYSNFRRLLYCAINPQDESLSKNLGIKEYAVKKSVALAKRYTPLRLKKICDSFHSLDYGFKNGEISDKGALELYIMKILNEI